MFTHNSFSLPAEKEMFPFKLTFFIVFKRRFCRIAASAHSVFLRFTFLFPLQTQTFAHLQSIRAEKWNSDDEGVKKGY